MNIRDLKNEDLLEALDHGVMIDKFKSSEEWKLIDEACQRLARVAQEELLKTDPVNATRIIELQCMVKLYRDVLRSIVNSFSDEGNLAFDEAKDRELVTKEQ